jgi:hypothetical protein
MLYINSEQFKVYDLDDTQSVINRIAMNMDTLPKYIYFPQGIPTDINDGDIQAIDILTMIKDSNVMDINNIYDTTINKIKQQKLDMTKDILTPYIAYNNSVNSIPKDYQGSMMLSMTTTIENLGIKLDTLSVWEDRQYIMNNISDRIEMNKLAVKTQIKMFESFNKVHTGIPYTKFIPEKILFEMVVNADDMSLLEIFNHITLNDNVPFATIDDFYKIMKNFIPSDSWSVSIQDAIIIKILEKKNQELSKFTDYTDAFVAITDDKNLNIGLSVNNTPNNIDRQELIDRFMNIVGLPSSHIISVVDTQVSGVFYFPTHSMNNYVFSDMVMTNPLFASMMSIDESEKASKQKSSIYVHLEHPSFGKANVNITEKILQRGDPVLKIVEKDQFQSGDRYIRVKVSRTKNVEMVEKIQNLLSRIFKIYDQHYQEIFNIYKKYIPTFGNDSYIHVQNIENKSLRSIAPDIFLPGYSRKCTSMPTIISDSDADIAIQNGKSVMSFPLPGEGAQPRNYICNHPKHIYPGLRSNPMSNKDKYPYIPCCYLNDQSTKTGSLMKHYYKGEKISQKQTNQQDVYKTNKFVKNDAFGELPLNISKFFSSLEVDDDYKFIRKGVVRSKNSFLHCVLDAIGDTSLHGSENTEEFESILYDIRFGFGQIENAMLCKQELYDSSSDDILKMIGDPDVYLDPKLFVRLLEYTYGCNIILFTRNSIDGELSLPRHVQGYYKTRTELPYVFIYEHRGSESDNASYPQCELICKWKISDANDITYIFSHDDDIAYTVNESYKNINKTYVLNDLITDIDFNIDLPIISQGIDSYGKCRMLNIDFNGHDVSMITSPLQPLAISGSWDIKKPNVDIALQFVNFLGIKLTRQIVIKGNVNELTGMFGKIKINIPVSSGTPIKGLDIKKTVSAAYPTDYSSVMENYNEMKKTSRYMIEYMFWLYSFYIDGDEPNIDDIENFMASYFEVDPEFKYGIITKEFRMDSGLFRNGAFIVDSLECMKRLAYVLKIEITRNTEKIKGYVSRTYMDNFYIDISDFDTKPLQIVLYGENSIEKWIYEHGVNRLVNDKVKPEKTEPYFFKNYLVSEFVYLAQNTDSLENALLIAHIWNKNGYNPGPKPPTLEHDDEKYVLYSYKNEKDIIQYGPDTNIKIIGFKVDEHSFFTVLLTM